MNVILTWHQNNLTEIVSYNPDKHSANTVVETMQRKRREIGLRDGVTWKTHKGGLVDALIASAS